MTLQQLEYVMAVYRFKHFAKAADYCNVTQPTLSSMIQKLEEELGIKIFDRRKQPVQVTPVGNVVIEQMWVILKEARRLKDIVDEQKQSYSGTFNLAVLPTIAPYLIPRFLPQLMKSYPDLDIRVFELKTDEIYQALHNGDIDAGILVLVEDIEDFELTHLYYEKFYVYVSENDILYKQNAIRTSELKAESLWLLDEGHCFRDQLVKFCKLKSAVKSKKAYHLGSIETFMRIVESGKGATFIPELSIEQLSVEQKKLVRPFAHPIPYRDIVLLTSRGYVRTKIKEILVESIKSSVPEKLLRLNSKEVTTVL